MMIVYNVETREKLAEIPHDKMFHAINLGPVVQSIVSLMSLLRDQLVKCFTTL